MAVNVTGKPLAIADVAGVTLIAVITAAVTVIVAADEVIPLNEAVMLLLPTETPVAIPLVAPVALFIVATPTLLDVHVT